MSAQAGTLGAAMPAAAAGPDLGPVLQRLCCILVVASAIKAPLGIPLYFNAGLLLLGVMSLVTVQALHRPFLWMMALIGLGLVTALSQDVLQSSGPRLAQLFLLVCAASLIVRLEPEMLRRHLWLLLPALVLVTLVEPFLPEPLYLTRDVLGHDVHRQAGLHGEPNYTALLYGVLGVMLAQGPPRILAILPFMLILPTLSRGVFVAILAWLVALALRRWRAAFCMALVLGVCLQPVLVLAVDALLDEALYWNLYRITTERIGIWLAHAGIGLAEPLGAGYFQGVLVMHEFADRLFRREAHSLFLQVFGDFGWVGYLLFVGFVLHVTRLVMRSAPDQLPLLAFLVAGYAFVNGLSDWAFWVPLGYMLAQVRVAERAAVAP